MKSSGMLDERPVDDKNIVPGLSTSDDKESVPNAPERSESSHPKFTIRLKLNHLYHVRIPAEVAKEVGLIRKTTLIDPSGKSWAVDIILRSDGQLELGVGWSSFSVGNSLVEGDKCEFEIFAGGDYMRVHIFRADGGNA
ncbi:B3 domain-containing protein Os01g0723500-like [Asparagus officinalis]|uniref:B3 domain-containing protein Os01g0723500-like n=1 Tax=Asparagus officinalis TaxID=4686 RepID=UPI00098E0294|nr:B3 domain-containing protein Os01g0723500-like [Asparagus officinalis]